MPLCAGEQRSFDWEPEVRLPKSAGSFGACVYVCLCSFNVCVGICMCASLRVHETPPANVTGKSQTVFCGKN